MDALWYIRFVEVSLAEGKVPLLLLTVVRSVECLGIGFLVYQADSLAGKTFSEHPNPS